MSTPELLTPALLQTIQRGDAILFLGAGASIGALGSKGEKPPSGDRLRDLLSDKFLGGALKDKPLSQVAEFAKNEADLTAVQEEIKKIFSPLQPAAFHELIPLFRWFAIVTTNFDLVMERAYDRCKERQQTLAPIFRDGDPFTDRLRDPGQVLYLKLHGCITHVNDEHLPLILASEEYAKHRKTRERLFRHFQDWGRERPIIFCGYDIADPNIQQILFDLADMGMRRPSYAVVNPGFTGIVGRYWAGKRFVVSTLTFEHFLKELDAAIPAATRGLAALLRSATTTIQPWIKSHVAPTAVLVSYLENELQHVYKSMPVTGVRPADFYRGLTVEWGAIEQKLDVRRRVSDDIILDAFLETAHQKQCELYLLKGHAGAGKSVTLRRIAWDIATDFDGFAFVLREGGVIRWQQLAEIHELTGERLYIVIEDAVPHIRDIVATLKRCETNRFRVSFLLGARTNEWNVYASELDASTRNTYDLKDLTEREVTELIAKLSAHNSLGRLENASDEERVEHFKLTAERQLLVALHDLGSRRSFEDMVLDEYRNIVPAEARILYMDVCTLHRLGVGVRAGLVSRISGITFDSFEREFFRPLEHVVRTYYDHNSRDNMYRSRHPLIADMVFQQALREPNERAAQIVRLIRNMDVDYESDATAFRQIIRGRMLADLFANKAVAYQIFDAAKESGAPTSHIEHQRAVFEVHHPSGDLRAAMAAIERAEAQAPHDRSVMHTKATILRSLALETPQRIVREKLREEAKAIVRKHLRSGRVSYSYHTQGQLLLDELRDKLRELSEADSVSTDLQDRATAEIIRQTEEIIHEGMQRFPGDEFLLVLESQFAKVLEDEKRALNALQRAFEANPGRGFVAVRLAYSQQRSGNVDLALEILKRSVATNPSSKETHFAIARILIDKGEEENRTDVAYHLRRSFTDGDSNFEAQFWYARHNFLYSDRTAGLGAFNSLADVDVPPEHRNQVKGVVRTSDGNELRFSGSVKTVQHGYCFLTNADFRSDVFAHASEFTDNGWSHVAAGTAVTFALGFSFRGPVALRVTYRG